jgi:predicted short-subunit dehydrogenase-like oxidoreductase (DUF2520 family)
VDRAAALAALLPLVRGTVQNLDALGIPAALTGPVERGDRETVAAHLAALASAPDANETYRTLSRRAVALAEEKGGISKDEGEALRALLRDEVCGAVRK